MKPQVQLLHDEKIIFDCHPKGNLALYMMVRNFYKSIVRGIFILIVVIFLIEKFMTIGTAPLSQLLTNSVQLPPDFSFMKLGTLILLVIAMIAVLNYWYYTIRASRYWYFLTDQRCIVYSGFIGINKTILLYSRVADVGVIQNSLDAIFGITNVNIDELLAAFPKTTMLYGLTEEDAANIIQIISQHMANKAKLI